MVDRLAARDTINPPGNGWLPQYIANILQKEGIPSELLELAPGRSALVARLRSTALADPSKALLLVAHLRRSGRGPSDGRSSPSPAL